MPNAVSALIGGGSSLLGGILGGNAQKNAAKDAANAQTAASNASIAESQRQFNQIQQLLQPYSQAGVSALSGQQALLGLNGADAQSQAIAGLQNSPMMQAMLQQGENSMLQNASATGGLRGGNLQSAMAQFRPQLLNQMIQQQYANLGGLTSVGQNAAAGVGNAGMQSSAQIQNALQQQGAAQAGNALARGQANANLYGGLGQTAMMGGLMYANGMFSPQAANMTAPGLSGLGALSGKMAASGLGVF